MTVKYLFHESDPVGALADLLDRKIVATIDRMVPSGDYNVFARTDLKHLHDSLRHTDCMCEVKVDLPYATKPVFIRKSAATFPQAVSRVAAALRATLSSVHKRRRAPLNSV